MIRLLSVLLLVAAVFGQVDPANAQWFTDGWNKMKSGYHRNKAWYHQYVPQDRVEAKAPFDLMVANGWRRQNLLGEYHFDAETGELTKAGELKIYWILTQPPTHRRTIFVQRDAKPSITATRLEEIQRFSLDIVPGGLADVQETHIIAEGHPAEVVDMINVGFRESQPAPVLPAAAGEDE